MTIIVGNGFLIGELSRLVGVSTQTIRYYERLGLLDPPQRTASRYRLYSEIDQERLQFIQKAKRFGLSLNEIGQLIAIRAEGVPPCADLKKMVEQHLDELDQHIQEMVNLRQQLVNRYQRITAVLPYDSDEFPDELCNGSICGFIEHDGDSYPPEVETDEA